MFGDVTELDLPISDENRARMRTCIESGIADRAKCVSDCAWRHPPLDGQRVIKCGIAYDEIEQEMAAETRQRLNRRALALKTVDLKLARPWPLIIVGGGAALGTIGLVIYAGTQDRRRKRRR